MMAAVRSTARTGAARAASSVAARGADGVYLGFDCSTQGLKATAVQLVPGPESGAELRVVFSADVNYDRDLPQFKTSGGMHVGEGAVVTSPPLMVRQKPVLTALWLHTAARSLADQRSKCVWNVVAPSCSGCRRWTSCCTR